MEPINQFLHEKIAEIVFVVKSRLIFGFLDLMHRNLLNLIAKKTESVSTIINPPFMVGDSI